MKIKKDGIVLIDSDTQIDYKFKILEVLEQEGITFKTSDGYINSVSDKNIISLLNEINKINGYEVVI